MITIISNFPKIIKNPNIIIVIGLVCSLTNPTDSPPEVTIDTDSKNAS